MTKVKRTSLVVGILVPMLVLGYGYWFSVTHGSLWVDVTDVSDRAHGRPLTPVTLTFLDGQGQTLAEAQAIGPFGGVYLSAPAIYACWDVERRAPYSFDARNEWDQCFARQSRWIPTWIANVKFAALRSERCSLPSVPVVVSRYPDDWWLWWVPLPHLGGKPYTTFYLSIRVDNGTCTVVT